MRHSDPSTFKTHIQVIIGITTFLILSSPNLFSKSSPTYSPSYKYSSLNLNHLAGPVEKLIYDESSVTFDKNGNIIQEKDKYVELNYTYNKKGYTIHNQHGGFEGEWYVTIDELHRKRIDKRVDGQSRASYTYTFDDKGRLISTVFEEKGRKVISSIHYPNEQAFKPDSSWHTTYYSRPCRRCSHRGCQCRIRLSLYGKVPVSWKHSILGLKKKKSRLGPTVLRRGRRYPFGRRSRYPYERR